MNKNIGFIYILTNPSFPHFVKIGYADDVDRRLSELNRSECIPYAFRLYAYYKVNARLTDMKLHSMIDKLNPSLRSVEEFNGKTRKREFYQMSAHQAFSILETIAEINNLQDNLVLVEPTEQDIKAEEEAEEMRTRKASTTLPRMDWLIEQNVVHLGDKLHLINHPDIIATLIDHNHVEYNGEKISVQKWAKDVTGWQAVQTYAYIKQVGSQQTLSELRELKMRELGLIK
ncbi:MAG: GIY-YIG nuclease family protein [Clostridia bacterium]|nr:GIY-YIG nuclease family protein [Clostridia bacterium]